MLERILFENARSTSMILLKEDGTVRDINNAFQMTFGYSKEDIIGKNFSMLFTEEDKEKNLPEQELKKALRTGSAIDDNYIVHKNGNYIWVHGESIYSLDNQGNSSLLKIIQDLTEQKHLENELKQKNEDLKRIIKDRDTFVYTASHDLQSPINNIEGLVKQLERGTDNPVDSRILFEMIHTSISKFRNTIKELSSVGKEQEEGKLSTSKVAFSKMLEEVLFDLQYEIESSEAQINTDFEKAQVVSCSPKNLRSILLNLVSNAIKYRSPHRKPVVKISTEKLNQKYILLKVQDNGLGLKPEEQEKVFEMYTRFHTHVVGSGVGLSLVKRILENAGGKIELESTEGEGTTLKVYLPD